MSLSLIVAAMFLWQYVCLHLCIDACSDVFHCFYFHCLIQEVKSALYDSGNVLDIASGQGLDIEAEAESPDELDVKEVTFFGSNIDNITVYYVDSEGDEVYKKVSAENN